MKDNNPVPDAEAPRYDSEPITTDGDVVLSSEADAELLGESTGIIAACLSIFPEY